MFKIEIKNEKINSYRNITLLVVIFNILFFIYLFFKNSENKSTLISVLFVLLYAGYRFYISRKTKKRFFFDEWVYFLLMILWSDNYLMAIINMVLFLLYTITIQNIIYSFDNSGIKQHSFPWQKYQWHELTNVILKDNLLTIDFKNNKIMQAEITGSEIDEKEFNAFAKGRLGMAVAE